MRYTFIGEANGATEAISDCDHVCVRALTDTIALQSSRNCVFRLFNAAEPDAGGDFKKHIDPHSLETVTGKCEPALRDAKPTERYQFERLGYLALDADSTADHQVWNRVVTLRDTWAKLAKK